MSLQMRRKFLAITLFVLSPVALAQHRGALFHGTLVPPETTLESGVPTVVVGGTVPVRFDGIYILSAHGAFKQNPTGARGLTILINGVPWRSAEAQAIADLHVGNVITVTTTIKLNAGDLVELELAQNSGSPIDIVVPLSGIDYCRLSAE